MRSARHWWKARQAANPSLSTPRHSSRECWRRKAEFRLAPAAEHDLEAFRAYTVQRWGVQQANHYLDSMTAAFDDLARAPETAPACEQIRPGYRRRKVGRYTIYVRITRYGIAIVRILHERMDTARHL